MRLRYGLLCLAVLIVLLLGVALGRVFVHPEMILRVLGHKLFGMALPEAAPDGLASATAVSIVWSIRLPRVLLAFAAGAALSVSGAVMQSVLRNPLASSFTLGVSSGASLGACLVIVFGSFLPFAGWATPLAGFVFGLATIGAVLLFAGKSGMHMENHTIILAGMVLSLFINAATTMLAVVSRDNMQRLILWQMGSFAGKGYAAVAILLPVTAAGVLWMTLMHRELDIMTFGEEQARTMGVNLAVAKPLLLVLAAALTGAAIAFAGVIGFIDLAAPHAVRRLFGAGHRRVIPLSALLGGGFMVLCDLAARTAIPPNEIPVGAVTALVGAPFFAVIYRRRRRSSC